MRLAAFRVSVEELGSTKEEMNLSRHACYESLSVLNSASHTRVSSHFHFPPFRHMRDHQPIEQTPMDIKAKMP